MQAFRWDRCGETRIWKGLSPSAKSLRTSRNSAQTRTATRYVVGSFRRVGNDFAPGSAIECPDAGLALQRADLMLDQEEIIGAIAFARHSDPISGEGDDALILAVFGAVSGDFDIA